jgi:hypothetical protein
LGALAQRLTPDGKTSQEIGIDELGKSDIAIFLISPYYGTFIKECKIKDCKADCAMKKREKISYTHCEYKVALVEKKLHQVYLIDKGWDIIRELGDWKEIDWRRVREKQAFNPSSPDSNRNPYR